MRIAFIFALLPGLIVQSPPASASASAAESASGSARTRPLLVETRNGWVSGVANRKPDYRAYLGIPYAEPPVGHLRFEPPQPLAHNWTGIRAAHRVSRTCLQWSPLPPLEGATGNPIAGHEDCLQLNVFVPDTEASPMPVMVFIHGGGLMWGSADFYGEQRIMRHGGLILVTFNYRLGAFGFLSTGHRRPIAGNMGLMDQSLALRWVHENIERFGGDKRRVLLAGWSAGGASVGFHLASPLTRTEWFSSAASLSGSPLCVCHRADASEAARKFRLLAKYLHCPGSEQELEQEQEQVDEDELVKCLKAAPAEQIVRQIPKFYKFGNHPFAIFGPSVEAESSVAAATAAAPFLTETFESLVRRGGVKAKPWLITVTADDGAIASVEFLQSYGRDGKQQLLIDALNEHWPEWAPIMLFLDPQLNETERVQQALQLRHEYFGERNISVDTYAQLARLFNDKLSLEHVQKSAQLYADAAAVGGGQAAAYGFIFDHPAHFGFGQALAGREDWNFGTIHGDDINLIIDTKLRRDHPLTAGERQMSERLIAMLAQFAASGTPSFDGEPLRPLSSSSGSMVRFPVLSAEGIRYGQAAEQ